MNHLGYQIDVLFDQSILKIGFNDSVLSYIFDNGNMKSSYVDSNGIYLLNIYQDVDLIYKAHHSELKEEIAVYSKTALENLKLKIKCENCSILQDETGTYVIDGKENIIWKFMPLNVQDAADSITENIVFEITQDSIEEDSIKEYSTQMHIDADWLTQAQFPIIIDPTIDLVYESELSLVYTNEIYGHKIAVPAESGTPIINDGAAITNQIDVTISHDNLPEDLVDCQIRNWHADPAQMGAWSKWYPIKDIDVWQLTDLADNEIPELKTVEVKYRISTTPSETPQEEEVGEEITSIEKYRWLDRFRNTTGGEVLNIVSYGNDIYIGAKIPYGNNFRGSIWKFNGKSFSFITYMEVMLGEDRLNVYPYVMKTIGGSIYIGAGRDDDIEGAGVVYRYNEANGLNLASVLGGQESKVTAISSCMNNIYAGTKENRVYKYNTDTLWSLVFDLSFEDSYQGVSDIAVLNGIYISFYDGQNSYIYFYDDIALRKIYTLYNEHIYSMKVIPARYNDTGRYDLYLQTEDKIFKCAKEKTNEANSVYEQMQNAPNSPWLRSYIDLPGKTENSFNQILSAAVSMPGEVFPPTIVGKNGYIATFNDEKTIQISSGVAIDSNGDLVDLNGIEIVHPTSNYYYIYGSSVNIDSEDSIYCSNSRTGVICKINTDGEVIHSLKTNNTTGADIAFTTGEDDDLIYIDKDNLKIVVLDKNFRHKKSVAIDFIPNIFMTYNIYDKYLYITTEYQIKVYDLKQERVVRTIGVIGGGLGGGDFNTPMQMAYDENHLYIADRENDRIQKFDFSGEYVDSWGSSGSGNGQFNKPIGIQVVGDYIYVSDRENDRIQKFDKSGNFQSVLTISTGTSSGSINSPRGLAVDSSGFLYIVEQKDLSNGDINRLQKFTVTGVYTSEFVRDAATPPTATSDNLGYIVGQNGVYLKSVDGGKTYSKVVPAGDPFGSSDLTSVCVNKNNVSYILITDDSGIIYYSSDGGTTWGFQVLTHSGYKFYGCEFDPSSNDFGGAMVFGSKNSDPAIISLTSDGSSFNVEIDSTTTAFPTSADRIVSLSFDNKQWVDSSYSNSKIYAVTSGVSIGSGISSQRILCYENSAWTLVDIGLAAECSFIYYYDGIVAVVGLNQMMLSEDDGVSWHAEEMGELEWWQRVFYYGEDYFGYAIGNYYQDTLTQRPLQKSPVRVFSPNYENWPVYENASNTVRRYNDVVAVGTVLDTIAPTGVQYGYITTNNLNILHFNSYEELAQNSYVVIKESIGSFMQNRAYRIVDITSAIISQVQHYYIYLDEVSGISTDVYNGDSFTIVNEDGKKNSLIINSPTGNTVVFGHRESGTKWYDYVNNTDGWVVEFEMCPIDGTGIYTTDSNAYQGVKIADGTKYIIFRIYKNKLELLFGTYVYVFDINTIIPENNVNFSQVFNNSITTDKLYTYTIKGWEDDVEVYIDGIKVEFLSGNLMANSLSNEKSIEFGDLAGVDFNSCAKWSYIYYKTDKEFTYETEELIEFTDCTEVKKIFHCVSSGYNNFQENLFEEDFTNVLWTHNTANTPWVDTVSNGKGWIVEFVVALSPVQSTFYDRVRVYDGRHGMEVRFYHDKNPFVTVTIGQKIYSFTSVGKMYPSVFGQVIEEGGERDIAELNSYTFRIEGEGTTVKFFINNFYIEELSGDILTNVTTQKYVDFGNNGGVLSGYDAQWGIIRYYISPYSTSTFDIYGNDKYHVHWVYIKEANSSVETAGATVYNNELEGWYVITQTDEPSVKMYKNTLNNNDDLHSLFSSNIFSAASLKYYEDITEEIGHVNDVVGFNYIVGDTGSYKLLFAGRDVEDNDSVVRMVRYGYAFSDIRLDKNYGFPEFRADTYISPFTADKVNLISKIYVVAQGRNMLQSKLCVYNDTVVVSFYKDSALTQALDLYQGVSVADFNTESKKVYIKIVFYNPQETLPTVSVNQQGGQDVTLTAEKLDDYTFKAEYTLHSEYPDDYIDGFAIVSIS